MHRVGPATISEGRVFWGTSADMYATEHRGYVWVLMEGAHAGVPYSRNRRFRAKCPPLVLLIFPAAGRDAGDSSCNSRDSY